MLALAGVALTEGSSGSGGCECAAGGESRCRLGELACGRSHVAVVMDKYQDRSGEYIDTVS